MPEPRPRKPWPLWLKVLLTIATVALAATTIAAIALAPYIQVVLEIRSEIAKLKSPEIYEPAARELALICQSVDFDGCVNPEHNDWMPQVVRDLSPTYGFLEPSEVWIEMGGGFYHYGYALIRDPFASTPEKNVWHLHMLYEAPGEILTTITLPTDERIEAAVFERLLAGDHAGS